MPATKRFPAKTYPHRVTVDLTSEDYRGLRSSAFESEKRNSELLPPLVRQHLDERARRLGTGPKHARKGR